MAGPFVSYAQNFEDVMLWRALRHVTDGFYIDAGAAEPELESVTAAFYERGWCGINIEPAPAPFGRLAETRTRDVNLNVALGAVNGEQSFLLVDGGNGLSTLCPERRTALEEEGWAIEEVRVPVRRLADLCREHVRGPVHFLKIDVEGAERAVLEGAELDVWRPWIVVVEATRPRTPEPNFAGWEELLLGARYRMVYADGLNRFYLAEEHPELAAAFASPPNVFDAFIRHEEHKAKHDAAVIYGQLLTMDARLAEQHDAAIASSVERDAATAEMWESNRHAAALAVQRHSVLHQLLTEREQARVQAEAAETRIAAERAHAEAQLAAAQEAARAALAAAHAQAEARLTAMQQHADAQLAALQQQAHAERAALQQQADARLAAVYSSTSWRIAAPVRVLRRLIRPQ